MTEEQLKAKIELCKRNGYNLRKHNEYKIEGNTVYVKLTNSNNSMICDIDVWEKAKEHAWFESKPKGYARTTINKQNRAFHHLVLPPKKGYVIDHINRNKLDNRRDNLRYASLRVNAINQKLAKNNTSGKTGVRKRKEKWQAFINVNNKTISLGTFLTKEEAIKARLIGEEKYYQQIVKNETC